MNNEELIHQAYAAFNARDIDAILRLMHPGIKWPKAFEGGYVTGHAAVRDYWERQWREIDPRVIPVGFRSRADGSLEVEVDQLVNNLEGKVLFEGKVKHVYLIQDDLLLQMDIE